MLKVTYHLFDQAHTLMTASAKTLHVRVFYTSSQKQLLSPDCATDFDFFVPK